MEISTLDCKYVLSDSLSSILLHTGHLIKFSYYVWIIRLGPTLGLNVLSAIVRLSLTNDLNVLVSPFEICVWKCIFFCCVYPDQRQAGGRICGEKLAQSTQNSFETFLPFHSTQPSSACLPLHAIISFSASTPPFEIASKEVPGLLSFPTSCV